MNDLILQPILFMGMLSLVMMLLMYITRIPAAKVLEAEGVDLQKLSHPAQLGGCFPARLSGLPTTTTICGNSQRFFMPLCW